MEWPDCKLLRNMSIFHHFSATVHWRRKDGEPLHEKLNATETVNTLTFRGIVDDHEGEYECYVQEDENKTATIDLKVEGMCRTIRYLMAYAREMTEILNIKNPTTEIQDFVVLV